MVRTGVTLPALMKLLGHKDPGMTMRYVEITANDLQREFRCQGADRNGAIFGALAGCQGATVSER